MTALDNPCPRCGKPIADTAYIDATCAAELAQKLREAAAMWPSLEGAIGRQSRTSSGPGRAPARTKEPA